MERRPNDDFAANAMIGAISLAVTQPREAGALLGAVLGVTSCAGVVASAAAVGQAFADLGRPLGEA